MFCLLKKPEKDIDKKLLFENEYRRNYINIKHIQKNKKYWVAN